MEVQVPTDIATTLEHQEEHTANPTQKVSQASGICIIPLSVCTV